MIFSQYDCKRNPLLPSLSSIQFALAAHLANPTVAGVWWLPQHRRRPLRIPFLLSLFFFASSSFRGKVLSSRRRVSDLILLLVHGGCERGGNGA
ncbi:unnamed protein product [Arabidopsis halleri]